MHRRDPGTAVDRELPHAKAPKHKGRHVGPSLRRPPRREARFFPDSLQIPANLARGHAYDTCIHIAPKQKTTHTTLPLRRKAPIHRLARFVRTTAAGPARLRKRAENYVTDASQPYERAPRQDLTTIHANASPSTPTRSSRPERRNSQECGLCRQKRTSATKFAATESTHMGERSETPAPRLALRGIPLLIPDSRLLPTRPMTIYAQIPRITAQRVSYGF
jgi:hypothetical protein